MSDPKTPTPKPPTAIPMPEQQALPDKMDEVDLLKYSLALEKRRRSELASVLAQREVKDAREEVQAMEGHLSFRYRITPADNLDLDTGEIKRGVRPMPPPPPTQPSPETKQ